MIKIAKDYSAAGAASSATVSAASAACWQHSLAASQHFFSASLQHSCLHSPSLQHSFCSPSLQHSFFSPLQQQATLIIATAAIKRIFFILVQIVLKINKNRCFFAKNAAKLQLFLQISKYFRNFAPKFGKKT